MPVIRSIYLTVLDDPYNRPSGGYMVMAYLRQIREVKYTLITLSI